MNATPSDQLVKELEYWLRVIGDRLGADRRFNETINDVIAIVSAPAQGAPRQLYELPDDDYEKFVEALGGNKPPTQALIDLMRGYRDNQARAAQCAPQPSGEQLASEASSLLDKMNVVCAYADASYIAAIHAHHALWNGLVEYGWDEKTEKFGLSGIRG